MSLFSIVYFYLFYSINCELVLEHYEADKSIESISQVLHDVADEFLVKQKKSFNIHTINLNSLLSWDILTDLMKKNDEKFGSFLCSHKKFVGSYRLGMVHSNIIFLSSLYDFEILEKLFKIFIFDNRPLKYLIYIPNLTYEDLESSLNLDSYPELDVFSGSFIHYSYFITNEVDTVTLSTVEWFSPNECNSPHLIKINIFDKKSMKWRSKLKNYEKFLQYHGCELVMMLPLATKDSVNYHSSGYTLISDNNSKPEIVGITPIIFEITSQFHNFTADFKSVQMDDSWEKVDEPTVILESNSSDQKIANVYFEMMPIYNTHQGVATSNVVTNFKVLMFVTPAEKYTEYEKFFLPFDFHTWILIGLTFILTFVMIFILNLFSKSVQSLFYGQNVDTPIWNVVSIFFGISQTKLPTKNFSRFILVLFIYFCLIFRTCFQSKFFEFLTSEPRRSAPKTVDDLITREYRIYTMSQNIKFCGNVYRQEKW